MAGASLLTLLDDIAAVLDDVWPAVRAALDGRLVSTLVTHRSMAELLLADAADG